MWYGGGTHHEGATLTQHAKKSDPLQIAESPKALVEVPLALLGALTSTRNAFFELCVDAGRQVLDALTRSPRPKISEDRESRSA